MIVTLKRAMRMIVMMMMPMKMILIVNINIFRSGTEWKGTLVHIGDGLDARSSCQEKVPIRLSSSFLPILQSFIYPWWCSNLCCHPGGSDGTGQLLPRWGSEDSQWRRDKMNQYTGRQNTQRLVFRLFPRNKNLRIRQEHMSETECLSRISQERF